MLVVWSSVDDRLYGLCSYTNIRSKQITIKGVESTNDDFFPHVTLWVGTRGSHQWTRLKASKLMGRDATLIVAAGETAKKQLRVNLDSFGPYIGKYSAGKIVLKTGDKAIFDLKDLLPPEK